MSVTKKGALAQLARDAIGRNAREISVGIGANIMLRCNK